MGVAFVLNLLAIVFLTVYVLERLSGANAVTIAAIVLPSLGTLGVTLKMLGSGIIGKILDVDGE